MADIVFKQFLGYMDAGNKVLDFKRIRRRYWTSWWAVVDVVSALPIDIVAGVLGSTSWVYRLPKLLRYAYVTCYLPAPPPLTTPFYLLVQRSTPPHH